LLREDNLVCERIQKAAHQISRAPLLGKLEERIGWFEESYRKLMQAGERADLTHSGPCRDRDGS